MQRLTGQIITRPMGPANDTRPLDKKDDRVLVAVVGVLAVDPTSPLNVEGRQFVLVESPMRLSQGNVEMTVLTEGTIDRAKEIHGMALGNALLEPIWRV